MKKRLFAIGDIHGCYDQLIMLMDKIQFRPNFDTLVFMGDYIDRGPDSKKVVDYVIELRDKNPENVILLKGNHEDMAMDPNKGNMYDTWMMKGSGGQKTIDSFGGDEFLCILALKPFVKSLKLWHETENHLFVHAGVPYGYPHPSNARAYDVMWDRNGWWFGKKHLIIGHIPKMCVTTMGNLTYVDTGCVFGGVLTAYEVNTHEILTIGPAGRDKRLIVDIDKLMGEALEDALHYGYEKNMVYRRIDQFLTPEQQNWLPR